MPHMNGFELSEKILAIDINVRICFMSSGEINQKALREIYPSLTVVSDFKWAIGFYDLLLVDINMPHMNGFELCEKILVIDINVRICFMSAVEINRKGLRDISITRHRMRYNQIIYRDRRNERARKNYQKN